VILEYKHVTLVSEGVSATVLVRKPLLISIISNGSQQAASDNLELSTVAHL
jgi:hypothetical protein